MRRAARAEICFGEWTAIRFDRAHGFSRCAAHTLCGRRCAARGVRRCAIGSLSRVRIKALQALQGFETGSTVRQTMIEALQNDDNPSVRVEAMNHLMPDCGILFKTLQRLESLDAHSGIRIR